MTVHGTSRRRGGLGLRSLVPVLLSMLACGCGSASPPPHLAGLSPLPADATPAQVVQWAFPHSSFDESVKSSFTLDTSDLPPAEAARARAERAQFDRTISGSITAQDLANFTIETHQGGKTLYLQAADGLYGVSTDGSSYNTVPGNEASELNAGFSFFQSGVAADGRGLVNIVVVGPRTVNGVAVERYRATLPSRLITKSASALHGILGTRTVPGITYRPETFTIDVARTTHFPVQISDVGMVGLNLSASNPLASGELLLVQHTVHLFSNFRPHARSRSGGG